MLLVLSVVLPSFGLFPAKKACVVSHIARYTPSYTTIFISKTASKSDKANFRTHLKFES